MGKMTNLIAASILISVTIFVFSLIPNDLVSHAGTTAMTSSQTTRQMDLVDDIDITTFKIIPDNLTAGENAKLIWEVHGAAQVFIDNNSDLMGAEVSSSGQITITPLKTTTYILTAYHPNMLGASAVATVNVHGRPPAPKLLLNVDQRNIFAGQKTFLRWETNFADVVSIDHGIGNVGTSGAVQVAPQTTTIYTLKAKGLGGSKVTTITVIVTPATSHNDVILDKSLGE